MPVSGGISDIPIVKRVCEDLPVRKANKTKAFHGSGLLVAATLLTTVAAADAKAHGSDLAVVDAVHMQFKDDYVQFTIIIGLSNMLAAMLTIVLMFLGIIILCLACRRPAQTVLLHPTAPAVPVPAAVWPRHREEPASEAGGYVPCKVPSFSGVGTESAKGANKSVQVQTMDWNDMICEGLVKELRFRGLKTSGNKAQLVERLQFLGQYG